MQLAGSFEQRCHGVLDHRQSLLEFVEALDALARSALGEYSLLDGFEFHLERIDHGKVAIDHRIHQGVEHESRTLAQQFGLAFTSLPDVDESMLAAISHRNHVVATNEDVDLSDVQRGLFRRVGFEQVKHHEQGVAVFLDLRPLVTVLGVFDGQCVEAELALKLYEFFRRRIKQRDPDEAPGKRRVFADLGDRNIGELDALFVSDTVDEHVDPDTEDFDHLAIAAIKKHLQSA